MAKISPISIKYLIKAKFVAEGTVEKPDVIGAVFGQTEGLLGSDLEMRELQKEGKIGRVNVELESKDGKTVGKIEIPSSLDQAETSIIGASLETIEKIGPSEAKIEVEKIEDVRGNKRKYIIDRAKELLEKIEGRGESSDIAKNVTENSRISKIKEYEGLPAGDISSKEIIVVEGRADVVNLLKNNINNVIAMNGTILPDTIKEMSKDKEITLFVDGDRGGKLIAKNVMKNAEVDYVASAPDGKEVEELTKKEILMSLRKRRAVEDSKKTKRLREEDKEELKRIIEKIEGKKKAVLLDSNLEKVRELSLRNLGSSLSRMRKKIRVIVMDGTVTAGIVRAAEKAGCEYIVAKNFAYGGDSKIEFLSL